MELVQVKILTLTITSQYGTLPEGTILRTSPDFAKHLVEDAGAAKYVKGTSAKSDTPPAGKPSDGLTGPQIKEALEAQGIEIPEGVTKKADLAALLDGAKAD